MNCGNFTSTSCKLLLYAGHRCHADCCSCLSNKLNIVLRRRAWSICRFLKCYRIIAKRGSCFDSRWLITSIKTKHDSCYQQWHAEFAKDALAENAIPATINGIACMQLSTESTSGIKLLFNDSHKRTAAMYSRMIPYYL